MARASGSLPGGHRCHFCDSLLSSVAREQPSTRNVPALQVVPPLGHGTSPGARLCCAQSKRHDEGHSAGPRTEARWSRACKGAGVSALCGQEAASLCRSGHPGPGARRVNRTPRHLPAACCQPEPPLTPRHQGSAPGRPGVRGVGQTSQQVSESPGSLAMGCYRTGCVPGADKNHPACFCRLVHCELLSRPLPPLSPPVQPPTTHRLILSQKKKNVLVVVSVIEEVSLPPSRSSIC